MKGKILSPVASASVAGLAYVKEQQAGIRRKKSRAGFRYVDANGTPVRDAAALQRIRSLVIPPAWTDVWICGNPNGHLQATGRDARNRKQYRYHPRYRAQREEVKYEKMVLFGRLLPTIRQRVEHDLARPGLPKEKVTATVVRLMDLTQIRIGNEEYARENNSFGLTTMRNRHAAIEGSRIHFEFRGKSGQMHALDVRDPKLARIVKRLQDVPGYELFQYIDEAGNHTALDSDMVNQYLRETTSEQISAKDFRTWHGTVHAAEHLCALGLCGSEAEVKRNTVAAIKAVAQQLGNRPATCRKYYVHPMVLDLYAEGQLPKYLKQESEVQPLEGLCASEHCVLEMLAALTNTAHRAARVA